MQNDVLREVVAGFSRLPGYVSCVASAKDKMERKRFIKEANNQINALQALVARALSQEVPDKVNQEPTFVNDGPTSWQFRESFKTIVDDWPGHVCMISHEGYKDGQHFSRSAAMRVDNVAEVVGVLQVLFKV